VPNVRVYLIVASSGSCRLTKRRPALRWNEVAFPITVEIPQGWSRVYDEYGMTITFPQAEVTPPVTEAPMLPAPRIRRGNRRL